MPFFGSGWPKRPLRTLRCADDVARTSLRHYRQITRTVLRWYAESEDGTVQTDNGSRFDMRVVDYRIDVDLVLKKFHPVETKIALAVSRDGLTSIEAVTLAGVKTERPEAYVEDIEIRLGKAFELRGLDEFLRYIDYLR